MRRALLSLLLLLAAAPALAASRGALPEDKADISMFRDAGGLFVISNDPGRWYTLRIEGKDVQAVKSGGPIPSFVADGKPLTLSVPPTPKDPAGFNDPTRRLIAFRDQFTALISRQLKYQVYPNSTPMTFSDGKPGMWINFELPYNAQPPRSRWFLARITSEDWLMLLSSGVGVAETPDTVRSFLLHVMDSVKVYSQPIDIEMWKKALSAKPSFQAK